MLSLFKNMLFINLVEMEIARRYKDQLMRCPVHLSVGQEAIASGVCAALRKSDKVLSNHRCHAHYLAKGGNLKAMLSEIHGKQSGCCGGRGGSMHLRDDNAGVMLSIPIVGSSIALAVGVALSIKQNKQNDVVVVFFGDGAIEEGVYHEVANFASLRHLPIVFVCENNFFSVYTHIDDRQNSTDLTRFGKSYGMHCKHINGNDVDLVYATAKEMINYTRNSNGPSFLQLDTYRLLEHCGPNNDDNLNYRNPKEIDVWLKESPIEVKKASLISENVLSEDKFEDIVKTMMSQINEAFDFAINDKFPDSTSRADYVYAK